MVSIKYVLAILAAVLAYMLYRHVPNRKVAVLFCLTLIGAGAVFAFSYQTKPAAPVIRPEEKAEMNENGKIVVTCEFCSTRYEFKADAV